MRKLLIIERTKLPVDDDSPRLFDINMHPDRRDDVVDLLHTLDYMQFAHRIGRTCVRVHVSALADESEIEEMKSELKSLLK